MKENEQKNSSFHPAARTDFIENDRILREESTLNSGRAARAAACAAMKTSANVAVINCFNSFLV